MKITILSENTSTLDPRLKAEFGFSAFAESGGKRILFDTGASGLFIENARLLGIGLAKTDFVVLSHGHWDHSGGLQGFIERFDTGGMDFIAHPDIFKGKYSKAKKRWNTMALSKEGLEGAFRSCSLSKGPLEFTPGGFFLGQVSREYEGDITRVLEVDGERVADPLWDDSAVAFRTEKGGVLLTGCSHSGILNLAKAAEKEVGRIRSVIGGFHLGDASPERLDTIISGFREMGIEQIRPGHCTGDKAIERMEAELRAKRITTGEVIKI